MHLQKKKLRGGLRGEKRGLHPKALSSNCFAIASNSASAAPQNQLHLAIAPAKKFARWATTFLKILNGKESLLVSPYETSAFRIWDQFPDSQLKFFKIFIIKWDKKINKRIN